MTEQYIKQVEKYVKQHSGVEHEFLINYSKYGLEKQETINCFKRFYDLIGNYPFYLSILMGRIGNMKAMKELLPILCDEVGLGKDRPHLEIYQNFFSSISGHPLKSNNLKSKKINNFIRKSYVNEDVNYAVGVLFALENMAEKMMRYLNEGLKVSGYDKQHRLFFTIHIVAEKEHAEHGNNLFVQLHQDGIIEREGFQQGAMDFMSNLDIFWNKVQHNCGNFQHVTHEK